MSTRTEVPANPKDIYTYSKEAEVAI